jgi:hypothetical protein
MYFLKKTFRRWTNSYIGFLILGIPPTIVLATLWYVFR